MIPANAMSLACGSRWWSNSAGQDATVAGDPWPGVTPNAARGASSPDSGIGPANSIAVNGTGCPMIPS
jgi:hypothetical protein